MKKVLCSIFMVFIICFMNGCSDKSAFYSYSSDTSEFDKYAKDTIGAYIYANYPTEDVKVGKGIMVYGNQEEVIYPVFRYNTIVDTYHVIQVDNEFMGNYSKNYVDELNNVREVVSKENPLKLFKINNEIYFSYENTIINSEGDLVEDIDISFISFDQGETINIANGFNYTEIQNKDAVKIYVYTKDTSEYDAYAIENFSKDMSEYSAINSSYELGKGSFTTEKNVIYPIWHNDSIVATYSVSAYYEMSGGYAPYSFALNYLIGKTTIESPAKLFRNNEICYVLNNEAYGTSTGDPVLMKDFDVSSISFTGGTTINIRDTLKVKALEENSTMLAYTKDTSEYDAYAKENFGITTYNYYGYVNNALELGKGMFVYGTDSQVIYPVWRNNVAAGLYKVIQVDGNYYSTYFTVNNRIFNSAQGTEYPTSFYEVDDQLYFLVQDPSEGDKVLEINGINIKVVKDINLDTSILENDKLIDVNEKIEYKTVY